MAFERAPAADLWRNTLSQIPSVFGRLVYLTSLRDQNTGAYEHFGLAQIFGAETAEQTLKTSHAQVFDEWLTLTLEERKLDLDDYLRGLGQDPRAVIATWLRISPQRNLPPAAARDPERQLFVSDVALLLELLRREHGVASSDSDA